MDDVPALAERFLLNASRKGLPLKLSPCAMNELQSRKWYGNVRELRNAIEAASVICRGDTISKEHLPDAVPSLHHTDAVPERDVTSRLTQAVHTWAASQLKDDDPPKGDLLDRFLKAAEQPLLKAVLNHVRGQRGEAAARLGIHRETLREKLRRMEDK